MFKQRDQPGHEDGENAPRAPQILGPSRLEERGESMAERFLPVIHAKGTHFEIGKAIGEQCKKKIEDQLEFYSHILKKEFGISWGRAKNRSKKYLAHCEKSTPELIEEIKGMAEGSGKTFEDLFAINCFEELMFEVGQKKNTCTGVAVAPDYTTDNCVYLGHNEDWLSAEKGHQYIIHAFPDKEPEYIAMTYGAALSGTGMNAAGIAQSSNSQGHIDFKEEGIPCVFVARKVLSASTIDEAVAYATMADRATGMNLLIVDDKGAMYSIETSALEHSAIKNRKYAIHSNHYISSDMQKYTEEEDKDSLRRYGLAKELVFASLKKIDLNALKAILSNHGDGDARQPDPYSLCQHMTRAYSPLDEDETISSAIFNLTTKTAYICKGTPCNGVFKEHRLGAQEEKPAEKKEEPKAEEKKEAKHEEKREGKPEPKDEKEEKPSEKKEEKKEEKKDSAKLEVEVDPKKVIVSETKEEKNTEKQAKE